MAVQVLSRRSALLSDRPFPIRLGIGELAVNINPAEPGLFFADSTSSPSTGLIKVGPTYIGTTAPNTSPIGYTLNSLGESWLDTASTQIHKLFNGTTWVTPKAVASNSNGKPSNPIDGQLHYDKLIPGLFMYNQATTAWIGTTGIVSVKDFGAVGDGVVDDTAALNAAAAAAGVAKKALLVPAGVYKTTAPWVIPPRVYVKGESHSVQVGYDPGNAWDYGAIIFKAHTGNAITKTGATAYDHAAPIENITVSSNRTTYPGGNGFVLDSVAGANLFHCRAFGVGGDSFVIGVSAATNTGNNLMEGCYSNNPTGVNYRVRQGYSRINNCLSDGGTHGMRLDNCPLVVVNNFHFEGFTSAGIYLENGCTNLKFNSGLLVNSAAALYGVQIASGGGNGHTFNGISVFGGANTASSVGVSIPNNSVNNRFLNCEINNWATGVDNNASFGNSHTWITDSVFYQNNLAIRSNGEITIYRGNSFDATIGTWDVSHVAGTKGVWSGNTFGKGALGINPVATGVQGNFSGIRVKENTGYVSRNSGITGAIAAYTNIAHGLAGSPKTQLVLTANSSGITSFPQIASLDATNFSLYWTGTATPQWNWEAALPCDY